MTSEKKKHKSENPVEALKKQNKELNEKHLRLRAEFDNYRKRTEKEMIERCAYANEKFISKLLGVIDDFELALLSCPKEFRKNAFYSGIKMILKNLFDILEKEGVTPISVTGDVFNPVHHEAIGTIESKDHKKDTILEIQKGYFYKDKVLRPAKVKIVK
ncbi:MAG: nucleotide exchange factor GrpE [Candidatus Nanohalarchaeota archaeon]|nr:MAG: nucleotide exchange factor GrpE [Candidatus Nanohaloarchaeota archaeon]